MKKERHIILIVDQSGSMQSVFDDTVGGMKTFIKTQQEDAGSGSISLIYFDNNIVERICSFADLHNFDLSLIEKYQPRGMTNLLDAIGETMVTDGKTMADMPASERPDKVMMCILTDGQENNSKEYTNAQIKEMIRHQEEQYNWDVSFLSSDLNAVQDARDLYGIQHGKSGHYAMGKISLAFGTASKRASRSIGNKDAGFSKEELDEMEE